MTTEREEFEAYVSDNRRWLRSIDRDGEGYRLIQTQSAWDTWKAARALLLERIANAQGECDAAEKLINHQMDELAVAHARIAELEMNASSDCPRCGMANRIEEMRKK